MTARPVTAPLLRAPRETIAEALGGGNNALNFLRLVLAGMVVLSHSWNLGGFEYGPPTDLGAFAVNGFFAISGYLIAGSRVRLTFVAFLWRRALRILPAFWLVLAVVAFGISPLSSALSGEDWEGSSAAGYIWRNLALRIFQPDIAHTLEGNPLPGWNGPLWTLGYEFVAYLVAGAVLSVAAVRRRPAPALFALLAVVLSAELVLIGPLNVSNHFVTSTVRLGGFFLAGMALWSVSGRLPVTAWLGAPAVALTAAVSVLTDTWHWTLGALPMAYALLWLGSVLRTRVGSVNDISYGVYIYGGPVQQALAANDVPAATGVWGYFLLSCVLVLPLASASWFVVERPALTLKNLVPGRRPWGSSPSRR